MIRYLKQYDRYSCGPIAVMNAAKWAGYDVSRKDLQVFRDMLYCTKPWGTRLFCFAEAVETMFKSQMDKKPTIRRICKELAKGKIVIVRASYEVGHMGHYYLITKRHEDGWFRVVNFSTRYAEMSISRQVLRDNLRKRKPVRNRNEPFPTVWYIEGKLIFQRPFI